VKANVVRRVVFVIVTLSLLVPTVVVPSSVAQAATLPDVRTMSSVTSITPTSGTIWGWIADDGGSSIVDRRFDWGTSTPLTQVVYSSSITVSGNFFWATLNGLSPSTTYYFRAWAKNSIGWSYGSIYSFTTTAAVTIPTAPTLNDVVGTSNSVLLGWTDNSNNEDGFKIERKLGTSGTYTQIGTTGANVNVYADSGLQFGKVYCYRVRAYNSAGNSGYSSQKCATTLSTPILSSPSNGATLNTNTVTLTWNPVVGANGYAIKVSKISCGGGDIFNGASISCQQQLSNLANGVYYWQVQAAATTYPGLSAYSACRYFTVAYTPPTTPTAPTLNDVVGTSNSVLLGWTDNSNNEDGFKIERKEGTSGTYSQIGTTGANVQVYQDSGLQFGKVYCYRVRAYNSAGNSAYSSQKCATTLSTPSLSSPSNGATINTNTVTLTWNPVVGANGYAIKVSKTSCGGGDIFNGASISCQQQLSNLANGVYYWQVQAAATTYPGLSAYSACRYFTVAYTPPTPPTAPTLNDVVGTSNSVLLGWTDNSNNEDGFKIERKEGTSGTYSQIGTTGANVQVYQDSGLQFGKVYCYRVRAYNSAGNSAYSSGKCATTLSTPSLSSPSNGATINSNTVTLTWNPVTGADGYAIKVSKISCGGDDVLYGTSVSCQQQLTNLSNGDYYWQVQAAAITYPGLSAYSSCRSFTISYTSPTTPTAPENLRVTEVGEGYVNLAWDPPSSNGGSGLTGYKIYRGTSSGGESYYTTISGTTFSNTNVVNGIKYYYRVTAINEFGESNFSNEVTATPSVTTVTLTLYIHQSNINGPIISGAQVTGQDGAGVSFSQLTNSNGCVTISGAPGAWSFTALKTGYDTKYWSQEITSICTKHAYLSTGEFPHCIMTLEQCRESTYVGPNLPLCWEIGIVGVGETFMICVGESTASNGIKEVRFSSDDTQDGVPSGQWTEWYDWNTSSGGWHAAGKWMSWSFATGGKKEVWVEIRDTVDQTDRCFANIAAVSLLPEYELIVEIDYMSGHKPTESALEYIKGYYEQEDITVTFLVDDEVPMDEEVTNEEFWRYQSEYNDGDSWLEILGFTREGNPEVDEDEYQQRLASKHKWVLYGSTVASSGALGYCNTYDTDTTKGNYIFMADNDIGQMGSSKFWKVLTFGGCTTEKVETIVLMHELGHAIGILKLDQSGNEDYDDDTSSVMAEVTGENLYPWVKPHYSPEYWGLRNMIFYSELYTD